ncbi:unnamed protein product, partial [Mesorhabditis spiculigera]
MNGGKILISRIPSRASFREPLTNPDIPLGGHCSLHAGFQQSARNPRTARSTVSNHRRRPSRTLSHSTPTSPMRKKLPYHDRKTRREIRRENQQLKLNPPTSAPPNDQVVIQMRKSQLSSLLDRLAADDDDTLVSIFVDKDKVLTRQQYTAMKKKNPPGFF